MATTTFNDLPLDIQRVIYGMKYKMEYAKYKNWIEPLMTHINMFQNINYLMTEHNLTVEDFEGTCNDVQMWLDSFEKLLSTIPDLTNKKRKKLWNEVKRVAPKELIL